jgi:hypothetical protein
VHPDLDKVKDGSQPKQMFGEDEEHCKQFWMLHSLERVGRIRIDM